MDAVKFLKEFNMLCRKHECIKCPLFDGNGNDCMLVSREAEKTVAIVEQWIKEHPRKTRLQDFLEKYPNAPMDDIGEPQACSASLGYCKNYDGYNNCKDCWNEPIE